MTTTAVDIHEALELLENLSPSFHGRESQQNWRLNRPVLDHLAKVLHPSHRTLETGCGYSTVLFCAVGTAHTVVSLLSEEHISIQKWCNTHRIPTSNTRFIAESSDKILPNLESDPLDLVLVDGGHKFPLPILDYHYLAPRIKDQGLLILDDINLFPVQILHEFVLSEEDMWENVAILGTTSILRKKGSGNPMDLIDWEGQLFCRTPRHILIRMLLTRQKYDLGRNPIIYRILRMRSALRRMLKQE